MKKVLTFVTNPTNFQFLLGVALLLRLVLIPNPGFEADVAFWKSWGLAVRDFGIVKGLPLTNFNYPSPFAYVLALMADVYSFFANPHNYNEYWNNANVLFLAICKTPSILADFGIFAVILWIGKNAKRIGFPQLPMPFYTTLAFIYLLSPLAMLDGALWGQVDSLGVVIFLIANCLVLRKKPFLAGIVYMIAMMTKLQNMIYGPVFFLFIWQYLGFEGFMQAVGGAALTFFSLNIEFVLNRDMSRVAGDLTGNYDYFPWMSLNAYNVWWIVSGAHGMQMSDKNMAIGIVNAKTVGLYMFASTYLLSVLTMLKGKFLPSNNRAIQQFNNEGTLNSPIVSRELLFRYLSGLIIAASGFFLFQTESHDRYAFPVIVFLLLWGPLWITRNKKEIIEREITPLFTSFIVGYILITLLYFYNLHNAFIQNYPHNGISFLTGLNIPTLTILASLAQIGVFGYFLYILRRYITTPIFASCVGICILLIIAKDMPLITKKPVYITKLTPISATAGYGSRQVDMPVMASFGFSKWGFLSTQYAFYHHGIGTHAPAREVYDINRNFKTLTTDVGIDTNGGPQGSVEFDVYGDGKQLYSSGLVTRYQFPRHANINVTGVKTLELIVTDGGNGNVDDHADWLNTQLIP
ncbi:MAG TPA: NPCBM/NEW2 domain-containing protein [Patescibacteria group bacterium]|nr:NPCBM/NEW2 domain-containing protein [Patescibacteria group bacterium]